MGLVIGKKEGEQTIRQSTKKTDIGTILVTEIDEVYYVLSDTLSETKASVTSSTGIPSAYDISEGTMVTSIDGKETHTIVHPLTGFAATLWEVTVHRSSEFDPEQQDNPENRTPKVRWYGEIDEEILEKDVITNEPIVTDCGEPMVVTAPVVTPVLEIKRYEPYPFNPTVMLQYAHKLNASEFWGAPRGAALMLPMEVDETIINNEKYCEIVYKIKFKIKDGEEEPWKARILHHGYLYRRLPGAKPEVFQDKNGNPHTVNLVTKEEDAANAGTKLPDDEDLQYKEWNRFKFAEFNNLTLGPFS